MATDIPKDIVGQRFDRLTVLSYAGSARGALWLCQCDCGNTVVKPGYVLSRVARGRTKFTSCKTCAPTLRWRRRFVHGFCSNRIFRIWRLMHGRCYASGTKPFKYYGAKGITVCEEWFDYRVFIAWAEAHGYAPGLTIDRINCTGNYEPGNCEWVTKAENSRRSANFHWTKRRAAAELRV